LLGGGGLIGFGTLVVRAFLQALRATADVSEEKNRTIDRQTATIQRQDQEIENLNLKLLAGLRELVAKDAEIAHLRAKTGGTT
jgi:hypothetical protein